MRRILAINGSYRDDGITDQLVEAVANAAESAGGKVEIVRLRDCPIEYCLNCRECMQTPGSAPGKCVLDDGMHALIDKIENADAYIVASPTNVGSVTAVFKCFMERLAPYAYWPWGAPAPQLRKSPTSKKKAVLVSSSAAPGIVAKWLFGTRRQLKMAAKTMGATVVGEVFAGPVAGHSDQRITDKLQSATVELGHRLIRS